MSIHELASGDLIPEWSVEDRMRKAREVRGLTQSEFAEETGLSRSTVRRVESGEKKAGRKEYNLWRMATGVSREWLEFGTVPVTRGPDGDGPVQDRPCYNAIVTPLHGAGAAVGERVAA